MEADSSKDLPSTHLSGITLPATWMNFRLIVHLSKDQANRYVICELRLLHDLGMRLVWEPPTASLQDKARGMDSAFRHVPEPLVMEKCPGRALKRIVEQLRCLFVNFSLD